MPLELDDSPQKKPQGSLGANAEFMGWLNSVFTNPAEAFKKPRTLYRSTEYGVGGPLADVASAARGAMTGNPQWPSEARAEREKLASESPGYDVAGSYLGPLARDASLTVALPGVGGMVGRGVAKVAPKIGAKIAEKAASLGGSSVGSGAKLEGTVGGTSTAYDEATRYRGEDEEFDPLQSTGRVAGGTLLGSLLGAGGNWIAPKFSGAGRVATASTYKPKPDDIQVMKGLLAEQVDPANARFKLGGEAHFDASELARLAGEKDPARRVLAGELAPDLQTILKRAGAGASDALSAAVRTRNIARNPDAGFGFDKAEEAAHSLAKTAEKVATGNLKGTPVARGPMGPEFLEARQIASDARRLTKAGSQTHAQALENVRDAMKNITDPAVVQRVNAALSRNDPMLAREIAHKEIARKFSEYRAAMGPWAPVSSTAEGSLPTPAPNRDGNFLATARDMVRDTWNQNIVQPGYEAAAKKLVRDPIGAMEAIGKRTTGQTASTAIPLPILQTMINNIMGYNERERALRERQ
jgi:hypothetical protein